MVIGPSPKCVECKHFRGPAKGDGFCCRAFPVNIPDAILDGVHDHSKPYPGDKGIRFEPLEEEPKA